MCISSQPKGKGRESRIPAARALELVARPRDYEGEKRNVWQGAGTRRSGQHRLSYTRYTRIHTCINTYQYTLYTCTHIFITKEMGLGGGYHFKNQRDQILPDQLWRRHAFPPHAPSARASLGRLFSVRFYTLLPTVQCNCSSPDSQAPGFF